MKLLVHLIKLLFRMIKNELYSTAYVAASAESQERRYTDWLGEPTDVKPPALLCYPPTDHTPGVREWVDTELDRRTGGLTRHPLDLTNYPVEATAADRAAQTQYRARGRGFFSHGMSMRYLGQLQQRAARLDATLTDEELMALRSRGLI